MVTLSNFDKCYIVMGGGLDNEGNLPQYVKERCNLVMSEAKSDDLIIASSSYSLNVPTKLNINGIPKSEASAIYQYLKEKGSKNTILCEQLSHDTVGSIYFSLKLFCYPFSIKKILFMTSDFHVKRVQYISDFFNSKIFRNIFNLDVRGSVSDINYSLRSIKEEQSLLMFQETFSAVDSESKFLITLFSSHSNYNQNYASAEILDDKYLY